MTFHDLPTFPYFPCPSLALLSPQLGFTERQIAHLMARADISEDGLIDYSEFEEVFNGCILELARMDAVDKVTPPAFHPLPCPCMLFHALS